MKIDRLFNVLVLGGAALATASACTPAPEESGAQVDSQVANGSPESARDDQEGKPKKVGTGTASAPGPDAGLDASTSDAAACAKECVDLGLPCCWMGDCTADPSCKAQLCD